MRIILIATVAKNYGDCRSSFAVHFLNSMFYRRCFSLSFTEACCKHRQFLSFWFVNSWSGNGLAGREPALDISFIDEVAIDSCLLKP